MGVSCGESAGKRITRASAPSTVLFNAFPTIPFCTFIPVNPGNHQPVGQVL